MLYLVVYGFVLFGCDYWLIVWWLVVIVVLGFVDFFLLCVVFGGLFFGSFVG